MNSFSLAVSAGLNKRLTATCYLREVLGKTEEEIAAILVAIAEQEAEQEAE